MGIPAAVAISAATTFERMPPEPSGEVVWPISSSSSASKSLTSLTMLRVGVQPRIGREQPVDVGQQDQLIGGHSTATWAARKSLSPKEISSVAVVSFSLMTGSTRHSSSVVSVWRALR